MASPRGKWRMLPALGSYRPQHIKPLAVSLLESQPFRAGTISLSFLRADKSRYSLSKSLKLVERVNGSLTPEFQAATVLVLNGNSVGVQKGAWEEM